MGIGRARKLCQGTRDSRQGLANHRRTVRSHAHSDSDPNARAEVREEARTGHVFLPEGEITDEGMVVYAVLTKCSAVPSIFCNIANLKNLPVSGEGGGSGEELYGSASGSVRYFFGLGFYSSLRSETVVFVVCVSFAWFVCTGGEGPRHVHGAPSVRICGTAGNEGKVSFHMKMEL